MRVTTHHQPALRPPMTDEDLAALQKRNADRTREAIRELGPRWVGWLPSHADADEPDSYPEPDDESLVPLLQMSIELARARKERK